MMQTIFSSKQRQRHHQRRIFDFSPAVSKVVKRQRMALPRFRYHWRNLKHLTIKKERGKNQRKNGEGAPRGEE
jgi:hypothetical protein